MKKKITLLTQGAMLLALSFPADAQWMKVPRVGLLNPSYASAMSARVEAFRQGFHELGYVEGKTIIIDYRYAEGKLDRLPAFVDDLVDLKVDVLVTIGAPATVAAKNASKTIPIVMITGDPVGVGLVVTLARPGANITGISALTHGLSGKRLELLKETVPKLSRVAILWNPDGQGPHGVGKRANLRARS